MSISQKCTKLGISKATWYRYIACGMPDNNIKKAKEWIEQKPWFYADPKIEVQEKADKLKISRSSFYKYKKEGMPINDIDQAVNWINKNKTKAKTNKEKASELGIHPGTFYSFRNDGMPVEDLSLAKIWIKERFGLLEVPDGYKKCPGWKANSSCINKFEDLDEGILPATLEFFYKDNRSPSKLSSKCKLCNNIWKEENHELLQEWWVEHYKITGDEKRKKKRIYYSKNKHISKKYRDDNKQEIARKDKERKRLKIIKRSEELNSFYVENEVPKYLWNDNEFPTEIAFQKGIEWFIVNQLNLKIERWNNLGEYGIPDIYIPKINIIIEVKLHSDLWKVKREQNRVIEQVQKYNEICNTVIVSLDGKPIYWKLNSSIPWFNPKELFNFISFVIN